MAQSLELQLEDLELTKFTQVEMGEYYPIEKGKEFDEKELWEASLYYTGKKLLKEFEKEIGSRECMICFFHNTLKDLENSIKKQNTKLEKVPIFKPLLSIRFDKNQEVLLCDRSWERIPTSMRFIIMCSK